MAMATAAQIAHILQHEDKFRKNVADRDVQEYFHDYSHVDDLYERVCSDMGIEPTPNQKVLVIRFPVQDAERAERLQALFNMGPMPPTALVGLVRDFLYDGIEPKVNIEEVKP